METSDSLRWIELSDTARARLETAVAAVLPRYDWIVAAYLHGSSLRPGRPARDVDVALVARSAPSGLGVLPQLERELAEAAELPVELLDVRIVNGASPVFLGRLLSNSRLLYESDRRSRVTFEANALSQWLDFAPIWDRLRRRVLTEWSGG